MSSSSHLHLSLPRKRCREDLQETCAESVCSDPDNLRSKRLHTASCPTTSLSSPSSCVSVCDAFLSQHNAMGSCIEAAASSESLVAYQGGVESAEAADSSNISSSASHEGESKVGTSAEACGLDHTFAPCTTREQNLRRTFSEGAESSSGEDAQVDINCFLKDWDEDVDALCFNPADVFKNNLHPSLEESCGAAFTPDSDGLGVSVAAVDNEDWFFGDLSCDGQIYWNEAQDQEWMTTAVANLDSINDAFATDASMLQLLEAGPGWF